MPPSLPRPPPAAAATAAAALPGAHQRPSSSHSAAASPAPAAPSGPRGRRGGASEDTQQLRQSLLAACSRPVSMGQGPRRARGDGHTPSQPPGPDLLRGLLFQLGVF
jgi:hypothetical protein